MIQLKQHSPPQWEYPRYQPGQPVAMFIPCYVDQFYPNIAQSMVRILTRLGVPLVFPKEQTCCGQPAFNSGYWEQAKSVIHHFCNTFEPYPWIVSPSGSCTAMCRIFFGHVDPDPRIVNIGRRVIEFSEFLVECLGVTDLGARYPHKITFHNGCHTRRELGVTEPPLKLLEKVRDLDYVPLTNWEECCGFGGTFSVKMPGLSLAMGGTKVEHIVKTGADVVVSLDISCLMHIGGLLRRNPQTKHIQTIHLAELLDAGATSV